MLKIDYWDKEIPSRQPVWDTSNLILNNTKKSDLIISVTGGDPTLLYLSNRNGWLVSPNEINDQLIIKWREEGAKYIAGSWNCVETYNRFSDKKVKNRLRKLLCNSSITNEISRKGCEYNQNSYLIDLN